MTASTTTATRSAIWSIDPLRCANSPIGERVFATIAWLRGRKRGRDDTVPPYQDGALRARKKGEPAALLGRSRVHLGDVVPVDQVVDESLEVVRPAVAVIDVIRVFP